MARVGGPKTIRTETLYVSGQSFKRCIRVDGSGEFSIPLPKWMHQSLGEKVTGINIEDVLGKFRDKEEVYDKMNTVQNKVILYRFRFSEKFFNKGIEDTAFIDGYDENLVSFANGLAVDIATAVCIETIISDADGHQRYFYSEVEDDETIIPRAIRTDEGSLRDSYGEKADRRLEWSQEREEFFRDISNGMFELLTKLHDISKSNKSIVAFMEKGAPLLGMKKD